MRMLLIVLVSTMLVSTPGTIGTVDQLDGDWWLSQTAPEQHAYCLGYITANWTWSEGLYQISEYNSGVSPLVRQLYDQLAPITAADATTLTIQINNYYRKYGPDTPLYQLIHQLYPSHIPIGDQT